MQLLKSDGPGRSLVRRLLPAIAGGLAVLAFLRWEGERQGLFGGTFGVVLMTAVSVGVIGALLLHFAYQLDANDVARREVEDELRRSSRYFNLSRDLVCTAGLDGFFTQLNAAWTETLGWTEQELRARPFVEFVHPDDRERTQRETAGLAQGGVTVDFANRYATKDGGWRWLEWKSIAVLEEGVIYASARDVTRRKEAEAALEASERTTRLIVEKAHDAFVSMDSDGLITGWNPQAEATFGWSSPEVLGRELAETIVPESHRDAHRRGLAHFLATGEGPVLGKRIELTALHRDGRELPVELTISPMESEGSFTFNAFLRDITERKRAQEEVARARDHALAASRMKSTFVANVSHEIRTPMNGVIGMTGLLLDTQLDDEQREYAETISSSGEALLEVIEDILDFSKIEAGKLELDPTDFDVRDAIEKACGMLAARAHGKGLELVVATDPAMPALVHGDAARLRQVVANFVSNAIKFTASGEVVVRASSSPMGDDGVTLRVQVSDTGIGIDPEALQRLFQAFSQADGSTTRRFGGTGLGLVISKQLVELMGGEVGAESQPGKGSSFWFELPLAHADGKPRPPEDEHEMLGLKVLVVDDNATNRWVLERQLSSWKMTCHAAASASEALALLESAASAGMPYALALLDLNMPDVDGYELACAIRARPALRGMSLVMLTSSGGRSEAPEEAGLDGFLTKPVRQSRLYDEIQAATSPRRSAAPPRRRRPAHTGAPRPRTGPAVLIVEDTVVNQVVVTRMLEKGGFHSEVAGDGVEALEALEGGRFAAVLMDCQMPRLDGYETTREVRRREGGQGRIPIIAMTASSMEGERERCLAAGMDDYLTKPLRKQDLEETLERWISGPPAETVVLPGDRPADGRRGQNGKQELCDEAVVSELCETLESGVLSNLVSLYVDEAAGLLADLRGAVARRETLKVVQIAHKLKGSSRTLGALQVSELASELEACAQTDNPSEADDLLDRLDSSFHETSKALRDRLGETAASR